MWNFEGLNAISQSVYPFMYDVDYRGFAGVDHGQHFEANRTCMDSALFDTKMLSQLVDSVTI